MPIYPDSRCCTNCGLTGVTTWNCSRCNRCRYCNEKGHTKFNCPKAPSCIHCGKKGHRASQCFQTSNRAASVIKTKRASSKSRRGWTPTFERIRAPPQFSNIGDNDDDDQDSSEDESPEERVRRFRKWRSLNVSIKCPFVTDLPKGLHVSVHNAFLLLQFFPAPLLYSFHKVKG